MIKKNYSEEYQIIKTLKKSQSSAIYLTNKYGLSFKYIIKQFDISKLINKELDEIEHEININYSFNSRFILKIAYAINFCPLLIYGIKNGGDILTKAIYSLKY